MKKRLFFVLIFSFVSIVSASAQTRTVTNEDLEKFRQKRLAAERDLRENYERLGFPSPEELDRQIEQSRIERSELAARLRAENLEREQLDLERQRTEAEIRNRNYQIQNQNYQPRYDDDYFYNYPWYNGGFFSFPNFGYPNNRYNRGNFRNRFRNQTRVEYRNNLPVIIKQPQPIRVPGGGRRN